MDHILSPEELQTAKDVIPEIPWLGYHHESLGIDRSFYDYPLQRGWSEATLNDLKDGELSRLDCASLVPFLQSWFSFGFLECAFGISFAVSEYVVSKEDGPSLLFNSSQLRHVIRHLSKRHRETPEDDSVKKEEMERFRVVLKQASTWHRILCEDRFIAKNLNICNASYHSVLRMFTLLGLTVQYFAEYVAIWFSGKSRIQAQLQNSWDYTARAKQELSSRLIERGWCPYTQTSLHPFGLIVTEYAAVIGPPSTHLNHSACSRPVPCKVHNINVATYTTLHSKPGCKCSFVRPSFKKLETILQSGGLPLVDLNSVVDAENEDQIEVLPYQPNNSYFCAISHVWSGGLGSCSEDGLPRCAIVALTRYMQSQGGQNFIWIDSLCIPREKSLRKKSIEGMNEVYSKAFTTLVIDPGLIRASMPTTRTISMLWLVTSAWMQRMWTLPEGLLSKRLYLGFSNGVKTLREIIKVTEEDDDLNHIIGTLSLELSLLFRTGQRDLRSIHRSLCYRTTSNRNDEAPALAALFDIPSLPILDAVTLEDKMALFWKSIRTKVTIPFNILFMTGPKLPQPGLRWAPCSLLEFGRPQELLQLTLIRPPPGTTAYTAKISENGTLTATYAVIRLTTRTTLNLKKQFTPIRVRIPPEFERQSQHPGRYMYTAEFTIFNDKNNASFASDSAVHEHGVLHDVDAFALNVWNADATTQDAIVRELIARDRDIVALSQEDTNKSLFRYRYPLRLMPFESTGNDLIEGSLKWEEISIS